MSSNPVNDDDFESKVIDSNKLVLVDFWAEWCAPCKSITPFLEEISEERKDQIIIFKINIDNNNKIPTRYGIRGIPTLMIFNEGQLVDTKVGSLTKNEINQWIDSVIN